MDEGDDLTATAGHHNAAALFGRGPAISWGRWRWEGVCEQTLSIHLGRSTRSLVGQGFLRPSGRWVVCVWGEKIRPMKVDPLS